MTLSDEDIHEILRIVDETPLSEIQVETDGFSLHVRRGEAPPDADAGPRNTPGGPGGLGHVAAPATPGPASAKDGLLTVESPMLGTFYRAEAPGAPPFVEVGSRVEPDTIVCIIEVMKMMNSVPAGVSGTVAEILPDNATLVEYGAPLLRVRP